MTNLSEVIEHYNEIHLDERNRYKLDGRLFHESGSKGQDLQLEQEEKDALAAFLKTLTGSNIYIDKRWSDPFDINGELSLYSETN